MQGLGLHDDLLILTRRKTYNTSLVDSTRLDCVLCPLLLDVEVAQVAQAESGGVGGDSGVDCRLVLCLPRPVAVSW